MGMAEINLVAWFQLAQQNKFLENDTLFTHKVANIELGPHSCLIHLT